MGNLTWRVLNTSSSHIHRFFDSSPFSPSNSLVAVTRIFQDEIAPGMRCAVVVHNLTSSREWVVAETAAWDSQVGAQVQWGATDEELVFNEIESVDSKERVVGTVQNIFNGATRRLSCPVYHVSSDGRFAVSPNISMIRFTQLGYGVRLSNLHPNENSPVDQGFYITDLSDGSCRMLVSLRRLSELANLSTAVPTYGFHAKWSSDGSLILLVMRTLELEKGVHGHMLGHRVRKQHLFVISPHWGSRETVRAVKYLWSWSSRQSSQFQPPVGRVDALFGDYFGAKGRSTFDGNHPNWIPGTHSISMNCEVSPDVANRHLPESTPLGASEVDFKRTSWRLITFDVRLFGGDLSFRRTVLPFYGTGHPSFVDSRYALLDAYPKEVGLKRSVTSNGHRELVGCSPLRLIDAEARKETVIAWVRSEEMGKHVTAGKEWRCDPHPAWSRDGLWVAVNVRPYGKRRQVAVIHLDNNLSNYF